MAKVKVNPNGFEDAMRKFKRFVKSENIIYEVRAREYFMTKREKALFKAKNNPKRK